MEIDTIAVLKRNISDTLTFLHQERNDFLPNDDIIIPSRKDDHVAKQIDLNFIPQRKDKINSNDLRDLAETEINEVIKTAEEVVNEIKQNDDSLDNLESLRDDSLTQAQQKSEEAFKFLENEASSPLIGAKASFDDTTAFIQEECEKAQKSAIPVSKNKLKNEIVDAVESKIPVCAKGKVKTIKKHSKDPLKEFVKLAQDVNWDDEDLVMKTDPIVKTTVTRITSESIPDDLRKIVANAENEKIKMQNESPTKSKIPVLVTETTRIMSPESTRIERTVISPESTQFVETTIVSPGSRVSTKSNTIDSDSDSDQSPQMHGILKKNSVRTVGSSSGSDVALHEAGGELSDDGSGKFVCLSLLSISLARSSVFSSSC